MHARRDAVAVMIATPLERELVRRIGRADERVELLYEPSLLPPPRYPGDHAGEPGFARDRAGQQRWEAMLERAAVLFGLPGDSPAGLADAIRRNPGLRWVHATAAGAGEQVRQAALTRDALQRVAITTSAGVHAVPLAEFAIFGLFAFAKDLPRLVEDKQQHAWPAVRRPTRELAGQTLFIVGFGSIGREVARLAKALGVRTVGFKRTITGGTPDADELLPPSRLGETIGQADAIVITLPLTAETEGMIDAGMIGRLRPHCVLVNVGRGRVIDEDALIEALRQRRIAGAALDVFAHEPLPASSALWELDNVILSPHTAALSVHENERITDLFVANLRRLLDGEELVNRIQPDAVE